jgi:HlyD family secretion protein
MTRRTKIVLGLVGVAVLAVGGRALANLSGRGQEQEVRTVTVERGDVVEKAVATGTIEPRSEVEVKSKVTGVVRRQFAEAGDFVEAGAPLLEIRPDPTPLELVEARRQLQLQEMVLETLERELAREQALRAAGVIPEQELERTLRRREEVLLQVATARERLALLEDGRVILDDGPLESMVSAPVAGYILDRMVQVGDPVVPLSTYQAGTVLFRMADMEDLVFRGTVDEIDVGRLAPGMEVLIRVGALPDRNLQGQVDRIALKGRREDQATVFSVEVALTDLDGAVLRAGYSANAEVIVRRARDALLLPERVIRFHGDSATVTIQLPGGGTEQRVIQTGVSDALSIEVVSGLREGELVLERGPGPAAGGQTTTGRP